MQLKMTIPHVGPDSRSGEGKGIAMSARQLASISARALRQANMKFAALILAFNTTIFGQDPAIQKLVREVAELRAQNSKLFERIKALESAQSMAESFKLTPADLVGFQTQWLTLPPTNAEFDTSDVGQGYQQILTPYGTLLVRLRSIEPVGDGQRITLMVGNLASMRLNDPKLLITWNSARSAISKDWLKTLRNQSFAMSTVLLPGAWNALSIVLPSTESKQTGYISVKVEPTGAGGTN